MTSGPRTDGRGVSSGLSPPNRPARTRNGIDAPARPVAQERFAFPGDVLPHLKIYTKGIRCLTRKSIRTILLKTLRNPPPSEQEGVYRGVSKYHLLLENAPQAYHEGRFQVTAPAAKIRHCFSLPGDFRDGGLENCFTFALATAIASNRSWTSTIFLFNSTGLSVPN